MLIDCGGVGAVHIGIAGMALCLFAGCALVPLDTIWRMRGMTPERFFEGDPRQLRVALRTTDDVTEGTALPQIRVDIGGPSTKPLCYAFALQPVDPRAPGEPPLDALPAHRRWFVFAASRAGLQAFDRARREVHVKDLNDGIFALGVTLTDALILPKTATKVSLRIDVALDTKDGYFTLIKETDLATTPSTDPKNAPPAANAQTPATCVPAA